MSDFERSAIQSLVDKATAAGVPIPEEVGSLLAQMHHGSAGARLWVDAHPDEDTWPPAAFGCCMGAANGGQLMCTCWVPVYAEDQVDPVPPASAGDLAIREARCGDCAFRRDSPEQADAWSREHLLSLPDRGEAFWCHEGMRRPVAHRHPLLGEIPGSLDDWTPPIVSGIPYRADGRPGLLCAGWAQLCRKSGYVETGADAAGFGPVPESVTVTYDRAPAPPHDH